MGGEGPYHGLKHLLSIGSLVELIKKFSKYYVSVHAGIVEQDVVQDPRHPSPSRRGARRQGVMKVPLCV